MARLTLEQIARENENLDASSTIFLQLYHRALSDVSCLASFQNLERLDLSFNCLSSLEGLSSCINLKWISVVENKLETLKGIERFPKLMVFNAGKNKLQKMDEISSVKSLRAVILNDNNISSICKLDQLKYLNTLVLSKNPISDIGDSLMKAKSLTKVSLSHCHLEKIGSSLTSCVELKELRLAHNKITTISAELARNTRLQNLDMGNNLIENWSELKVLSSLPNLKNLNFQGNPIAEKDKLAKKVKQLVPYLRIFNAKPTEVSNKSKKFLGENTLSRIDPPLHNSSDVEADKEVKRKKSKKDVKTSERNISERFSEKVHVIPGSSNDEVGMKTNRKKSQKDVPEKTIPNQTKDVVTDLTNLSAAKKAKSREFENEELPWFTDIREIEALSADPVLHGKSSQNIDRKKKDHKVVHDEKLVGGLVIEHKKKKKAKNTDLSALQLLSANSEVGLGGPSTWDD